MAHISSDSGRLAAHFLNKSSSNEMGYFVSVKTPSIIALHLRIIHFHYQRYNDDERILTMKKSLSIPPLFSVFLFLVSTIYAADPVFNRMAVVDSIMQNFHIEYCCGGTTTDTCIEEKPECTIADRLYAFADWVSGFGAPPDTITRYVRKRYESFIDTETVAIDTTHLQCVGDPKAPILIIAYISANCSSCKRVIGNLYEIVTTGKLRGKAKLIAKPYGKGIGDIALYAAACEGTFWKLFLKLRIKRGILKDEKDVIAIAESIGIASESFVKRLKDPKTKKLLDASRAEGKRYEVKYTPTIYLNGKRYRSSKTGDWIADAVLFEIDKTQH
jgi:hypothetical protein